jgi:hypothetical protein
VSAMFRWGLECRFGYGVRVGVKVKVLVMGEG